MRGALRPKFLYRWLFLGPSITVRHQKGALIPACGRAPEQQLPCVCQRPQSPCVTAPSISPSKRLRPQPPCANDSTWACPFLSCNM